MIFTAAICFVLLIDSTLDERSQLILLLLFIWAIRLAAHITWRNWGQEEDLRYQTIRKNNQPNFEFKSLFIVFLLQAWLAVIVALPMMSILNTDTVEQHISTLDYIAFSIWLSSAMLHLYWALWQLAMRTQVDIIGTRRNDRRHKNHRVGHYG